MNVHMEYPINNVEQLINDVIHYEDEAIIQKNGKPVAILMSYSQYRVMLNEIERLSNND